MHTVKKMKARVLRAVFRRRAEDRRYRITMRLVVPPEGGHGRGGRPHIEVRSNIHDLGS